MVSRYCCSLLILGLPLLAAQEGEKREEESPASSDAGESRVEIQQITLPNPVGDPVTLLNRAQLAGAANLPMRILPAMIRVQHKEEGFGYAWDPVECRLLFAWRGEDPRNLVFVAEGPGPLASTIGVWGPPDYFGYRMVDGVPEFLYRLGKIAIEERLQPSQDGTELVQHWKIYQAEFGVMFSLPQRCRPLVKASAGNWSNGSLLDLTQGEAREFTLTWTWPGKSDIPELTTAWQEHFAAITPAAPPEEESESFEDDSAPPNSDRP